MGHFVPPKDLFKLTRQEAIWLLQLGEPRQHGEEMYLEVQSPIIPIKMSRDQDKPETLLRASMALNKRYEDHGIRPKVAKELCIFDRDGGAMNETQYHAFDFFDLAQIEAIAGMNREKAKTQAPPPKTKGRPKT